MWCPQFVSAAPRWPKNVFTNAENWFVCDPTPYTTFTGQGVVIIMLAKSGWCNSDGQSDFVSNFWLYSFEQVSGDQEVNTHPRWCDCGHTQQWCVTVHKV